MLLLNSPRRCRSSGTGWKLARVRCVAGPNTSLRHLFCKSVVIAHPKRQFLISSIRGEVKKKHNCIDRSFPCFPAHVNEPGGPPMASPRSLSLRSPSKRSRSSAFACISSFQSHVWHCASRIIVRSRLHFSFLYDRVDFRDVSSRKLHESGFSLV